jgi:hypothetical protein
MKKYLAVIILVFLPFAVFSDVVKKIPGTFRVKKITELWEENSDQSDWYDYTYDAKGNLSRVDYFREKSSPSSSYTYENDDKGKLVGITEKTGDGEIISVTKIEYDKEKKIAETVANKNGNVTQAVKYYYNEKGQLFVKTEKNDWLTQGVVSWNSLTLSSYDSKGGFAGDQYFYDAEFTSKSQVKLATDKNGSSVTIADYSPGGEYLGETRLQYDQKDQLTMKSYKTKDNDHCASYTARMDYDASGNVKQIKLFNNEMKLIQTFVFEWEKGKFDKPMLEAIFENLIRVGC